MAFMRIRSPSSAPPPLRRVGSMESTAMRSLSSWSSRKRRTSSSVSEDLPAPPVPVMPSTGRRVRRGEQRRASAGSRSGLGERDGAGQRAPCRPRSRSSQRRRGHARRGRRRTHRIISLIIPGRPRRWPSSGLKMRATPYSCSSCDLARHDHAAAAAEDLDVPAAALAQQVDHVLEVLDVAALVRADRDALRVLLQRGRDDLVDRAVVAEVDHLGALALQDAPHDVDRRVVAVEQARRGDEADGVRRHV